MRNRVNYRRIWEKYNKACIMPGMHVHHIDGNPNNNDPLNLKVCTPEEHIRFHKDLGHKIMDNFIGKANQWELKSEEEQSIIKEKISRAVKGKNKGRIHTEKSRKNMSDAHIGQVSYWKGKKMSKKVTEAAVKANKGRKQSTETKEKRRKSMLDNKRNQRGSHGSARKVKCLKTQKTWNCIKDASEELSINYVSLKQFLNNPTKRSKTKYPQMLNLRFID